MKILSYTNSWTMSKDETLDYILDRFYDNFYAKLPKSSVYFISVMDHTSYVDGERLLKTIIRFTVRSKERSGHRNFELDTDNGWIERV